MSEWRPGWVLAGTPDMGVASKIDWVRLTKDQRWFYLANGSTLPLTVISTAPSGEVVLRPPGPIPSRWAAEDIFPLQEVIFKGNPTMSRPCPFVWVDERQAKGSHGAYRAGDLLAHEAWDLWKSMRLVESL
jgi:hypothetical protein